MINRMILQIRKKKLERLIALNADQLEILKMSQKLDKNINKVMIKQMKRANS